LGRHAGNMVTKRPESTVAKNYSKAQSLFPMKLIRSSLGLLEILEKCSLKLVILKTNYVLSFSEWVSALPPDSPYTPGAGRVDPSFFHLP